MEALCSVVTFTAPLEASCWPIRRALQVAARPKAGCRFFLSPTRRLFSPSQRLCDRYAFIVSRGKMSFSVMSSPHEGSLSLRASPPLPHPPTPPLGKHCAACDKGFIGLGALEETREATKKISYIAVCKLEYKAAACLCRFRLPKALGDKEKSLKTRQILISCALTEGLREQQ